jgi:1-deoxy-D-xylulose-5-phosphate synthase
MSIGPNVGAIAKHLSRLTMKSGYQRFRMVVDKFVKKIPLMGSLLYSMIVRLKRSIKVLFYPENFFVELGFEYVGPVDGHHMSILEEVLQDVRKLNRPVVVHVVTCKGKGYHFAEDDPASFHGVPGFSIMDGVVEKKTGTTFTDVFSATLSTLGEKNPSIVAITAAMEKGTGLGAFHNKFPNRFFDVGIAEEHAITFAAGLALQGLHPVVVVYSSFIQRSVDQIIHDVALQKAPVTIVLDRAGFVSDDGETHQGLFDIALFRGIPNITLLAPASALELQIMLSWAVTASVPCIIRYPKALCPQEQPAFLLPIEQGRGIFVRKNTNATVCIMFTGSLYPQVMTATTMLVEEGIVADLYDLRFLKPIDEEYLSSVISKYSLVVCIEEGMKNGGFGEYLVTMTERIAYNGTIIPMGAPSIFFAQGTREELLHNAELDASGIVKNIVSYYTTHEQGQILHVVGK